MTNSEVEKLINQRIAAAAVGGTSGTTPADWAKDAWFSACMAGVFDGSNPLQYPNRQQIAVILNRLGVFPQLKCPEDANFSTVVAGQFKETLTTSADLNNYDVKQ